MAELTWRRERRAADRDVRGQRARLRWCYGDYPVYRWVGIPCRTCPLALTAIVDLLGALAYGELSAFDRLADDARMAPTLVGRAPMSGWRLSRLATTGCSPTGCIARCEPEAAMEPFVPRSTTSTG